jgi:hypothetical protein
MRTEMDIDRNTISGFALRTRKNLEFLFAARKDDCDVHEVTQLIVSLLGLVVFPYAHFVDQDDFDCKNCTDPDKKCELPCPLPEMNFTLPEMCANGWPEWTISLGKSKTFSCHLRHLRNAISHRRIHFDSDYRDVKEVEVTLWDKPARKQKPINWRANIKGGKLLHFTLQLSKLLERYP